MAEKRLDLVIDPTKAEAGGKRVRKVLVHMQQDAKALVKSFKDANAAIGNSKKILDTVVRLEKQLKKLEGATEDVGKSSKKNKDALSSYDKVVKNATASIQRNYDVLKLLDTEKGKELTLTQQMVREKKKSITAVSEETKAIDKLNRELAESQGKLKALKKGYGSQNAEVNRSVKAITDLANAKAKLKYVQTEEYKALQKINAEIKKHEQNVEASIRPVKKAASAQELYRKAVVEAQKKAREEIRKSNAQIQVLSTKLGKNSVQVKANAKLQRDLAEAQAQVKIRSTAEWKELQKVNKQLRDMDAANRNANKSTDDLSNAKGKASSSSRDLQRSLMGVGIAASMISGTEMFGQLTQTLDAYTEMNNKIAVVTGTTNNLAGTTRDLLEVSLATRTSLKATTDLYSKLTRVNERYGFSQKEVLDITTTVSQAVAMSGATTSAAEGAVIQFSQALAGDFKTAGQELNSILEQTPGLAQAIAKGLTAMGDGAVITSSQLKKMAKEGLISTADVLNGLKAVAADVASDFEKSTKTIAQAQDGLVQAFTVTSGEIDKIIGLSKTLTESLETVTDVVKENKEVVGALGGAFTGLAVTAIGGTIIALGGLVGLPWIAIATGITAIAAGIGGLVVESSDAAVEIKTLTDELKTLSQNLTSLQNIEPQDITLFDLTSEQSVVQDKLSQVQREIAETEQLLNTAFKNNMEFVERGGISNNIYAVQAGQAADKLKILNQQAILLQKQIDESNRLLQQGGFKSPAEGTETPLIKLEKQLESIIAAEDPLSKVNKEVESLRLQLDKYKDLLKEGGLDPKVDKKAVDIISQLEKIISDKLNPSTKKGKDLTVDWNKVLNESTKALQSQINTFGKSQRQVALYNNVAKAAETVQKAYEKQLKAGVITQTQVNDKIKQAEQNARDLTNQLFDLKDAQDRINKSFKLFDASGYLSDITGGTGGTLTGVNSAISQIKEGLQTGILGFTDDVRDALNGLEETREDILSDQQFRLDTAGLNDYAKKMSEIRKEAKKNLDNQKDITKEIELQSGLYKKEFLLTSFNDLSAQISSAASDGLTSSEAKQATQAFATQTGKILFGELGDAIANNFESVSEEMGSTIGSVGAAVFSQAMQGNEAGAIGSALGAAVGAYFGSGNPAAIQAGASIGGSIGTLLGSKPKEFEASLGTVNIALTDTARLAQEVADAGLSRLNSDLVVTSKTLDGMREEFERVKEQEGVFVEPGKSFAELGSQAKNLQRQIREIEESGIDIVAEKYGRSVGEIEKALEKGAGGFFEWGNRLDSFGESVFGAVGFINEGTQRLQLAGQGGQEWVEGLIKSTVRLDDLVGGLARTDDELQNMITAVKDLEKRTNIASEAVEFLLVDRTIAAIEAAGFKLTDAFKGLDEESFVIRTENAIATFNLLSEAADVISIQFDKTSADAFMFADELTNLSGGFENLSTNFNTFIKEFKSEEEQFDILTNSLTKTFEEVGKTLPKTRDGFNKLISTITDPTALSAIFNVIGAIDQYYDKLEELPDKIDRLSFDSLIQDDILFQRTTMSAMEQQLMQLEGEFESIGINLDEGIPSLIEFNSAINLVSGSFTSEDWKKAEQAAEALDKFYDSFGSIPSMIASEVGTTVESAQAAVDKYSVINNKAGQGLVKAQMNVDQYQDYLDEFFGGEIPDVDTWNEVSGAFKENNDLTAETTALVNDMGAAVIGYNDALTLSSNAQETFNDVLGQQGVVQANIAAENAKQAAIAQQRIQQEQMGLVKQILVLEGKHAELRKLEIDALHSSNQGLQARIWLLEDEKQLLENITDIQEGFSKIGLTFENLMEGMTDSVNSIDLSEITEGNVGKINEQIATARDEIQSIKDMSDFDLEQIFIKAQSTSISEFDSSGMFGYTAKFAETFDEFQESVQDVIEGKEADIAGWETQLLSASIADTIGSGIENAAMSVTDQYATGFAADLQEALAVMFDVDISEVGSTVSEVLDKYSQAAFSQEELAEIAVANAEAAFAPFLDLEGVTAGMNISDFRSLFESVKDTLTPEELAKWIAAAGAISDLTLATEELLDITGGSLEDILSDLESGFDDAMRALKKAIDTEKKLLKEQHDLIVDDYKEQIDTVKDGIKDLEELSRSLENAIRGTRIESFRLDRDRRSAAQSSLRQALLSAQTTGVLPEASDLSGALSELQRPSIGFYTNFADYARDQAKTASDILDLNELTEGQLTTEQSILQTLEADLEAQNQYYEAELKRFDDIIEEYQRQFDALQGIDGSIMSVEQAIQAVETALTNLQTFREDNNLTPGTTSSTGSSDGSTSQMTAGEQALALAAQYGIDVPNPDSILNMTSDQLNQVGSNVAPSKSGDEATFYTELTKIDGSFRTGLTEVPRDNFLINAHKGERLLNEQENRIFSGMLNSGSNETMMLRQEVSQMRREVATLLTSINQHSSNTSNNTDTLRRWERNPGNQTVTVA